MKPSMSAIELLTADHRAVQDLVAKYAVLAAKVGPAPDRKELAEQIFTMLIVHSSIEEELLYPAARDALPDFEALLDEARVEHETIRTMVAELQAMSPDEPLYDAKVRVLGEYVEHHAIEEEGQLFPKLRATPVDLEALGLALASRQEELLEA
jgi:hemerythrin superfamily protein